MREKSEFLMLQRIASLVVVLVVAATGLVDAQRRHPVSGRVLAPVMGVGGAGWLERSEREQEEAPSKAIAALELEAGHGGRRHRRRVGLLHVADVQERGTDRKGVTPPTSSPG